MQEMSESEIIKSPRSNTPAQKSGSQSQNWSQWFLPSPKTIRATPKDYVSSGTSGQVNKV